MIIAILTSLSRSRKLHLQPSSYVSLHTHIALWIQEAPPPIIEEALRVVIDGLHDLGPVQALNAFSELDVALTREWVGGDRDMKR